MFRYAGRVGVDPERFSLRQLQEMCIGRDLAEWRMQAWLVASVRNMFAKQAITPDSINPYLAEALKAGWIEPPHRPHVPFSLSLASVEALVDPSRRW